MARGKFTKAIIEINLAPDGDYRLLLGELEVNSYIVSEGGERRCVCSGPFRREDLFNKSMEHLVAHLCTWFFDDRAASLRYADVRMRIEREAAESRRILENKQRIEKEKRNRERKSPKWPPLGTTPIGR